MVDRPTLNSLARETGVSRQTVSNVLNAPELVSPETRGRVERAIAASGYRPSAAARALRNRRTLTMALRLHPRDDEINGHLMDGFVHCLVEQAARRHYSITLFTAASLEDEIAATIDLFHRRVVDAAIVTGAHPEDPRPQRLAEAGVPFGVFGRPWTDADGGYPWADIDGRAGVREATEHLLDHGHRRVGFIGWAGASWVGEDRLAGWRDVARARDLDESRDCVIRVEGTVAQGAVAMATLLDDGVDAVVCSSDSLAIGALETMRHRDLIGPDTARAPIIGFDDTPVARALGISSIHQPVEQAAEHLVSRLVFDLTAGSDGDDSTAPARTALFAPELAVRSLLRYEAGPPTTSSPQPSPHHSSSSKEAS